MKIKKLSFLVIVLLLGVVFFIIFFKGTKKEKTKINREYYTRQIEKLELENDKLIKKLTLQKTPVKITIETEDVNIKPNDKFYYLVQVFAPNWHPYSEIKTATGGVTKKTIVRWREEEKASLERLDGKKIKGLKILNFKRLEKVK